MNPYPDTGFLCSLYSHDANSQRAIAEMRRVTLPMSFTWIHQLELRNAMRLRVFRKEITRQQSDASLNLLLADLAEGVLLQIPTALDSVTLEAERLSATHSEKLGTRSLDILHVAIAIGTGADFFITFDKRQASLAKAAGIKVRGL
jgi:predicted nucleic acid-binding protein